VIGLLIRYNFLYNQIKNLHAFNFFEEIKDGDSAGDSFPINEKAIKQADLKLLGSTVESLIVDFDQEKFEQLLSSALLALKSQVRLALKSLRRLLIEKPIRFLTKQVAQPLLRV